MRPGQICSSALGQVYILTFHGARVGDTEGGVGRRPDRGVRARGRGDPLGGGAPRRGGLPEGIEIVFRRLPPSFRLLPGWLEGALPLPSGPIYGSEAIAVVGGREVPLGELLIVGMYDVASGQGVLLRDEEIEPQVEGVRRAARALLAGALELR